MVHVAITAKGVRLLSRLDQPVIDLHHQLIGHLTERELRQLIRLLEKARQRLERPIDNPPEFFGHLVYM